MLGFMICVTLVMIAIIISAVAMEYINKKYTAENELKKAMLNAIKIIEKENKKNDSTKK